MASKNNPPVAFKKAPSKKYFAKIYIYVRLLKTFYRHVNMTLDYHCPTIEENIPLPTNAKEAFPSLSPTDELNMRANVIKLLSDLTESPISPTEANVVEAKAIATEMAANPNYRPQFPQYQNETLALLAGMVAQMNASIVDDLADLKMYVINKLVAEIENTQDSKIRVAALKHLGDVDGVDAFKKRTEVTIKVQTIEEVEKELLETLSIIEGRVIDAEARQIIAAR